MLRRRHRHGPYALARTPRSPLRAAKPFVALAIAAWLLYIIGSWVLSALQAGNAIHRDPVSLRIEDRGTVNVSLNNGDMRRAEGELKLYPEDRVTTGGSAHAMLEAFDGTLLRLDEGSDIRVQESARGEESSTLTFRLLAGGMWVATPAQQTFSGSITRTIITPEATYTLPSRSEVALTTQAITVFSADGLGVDITLEDGSTVTIGEGQRYVIPTEGEGNTDVYATRSPLDPTVALAPFITESRTLALAAENETAEQTDTGTGSDIAPETDDGILAITAPQAGTTVVEPTVVVAGRIGPSVVRVRVNGYQASIDVSRGTFQQEIALPESGDSTITVEALDAEGVMLAKRTRSIQRSQTPPQSVTIRSPGATGETYATTESEIEISGTVQAGTEGIEVNGYRLQLFEPGDTSWSYLASIRLGNAQEGANTYTVTAIGPGGLRSEPASIVIVMESESEGVVSSEEPIVPTEEEVDQPDVTTLPDNDPLRPGSLTVRAPAEGTEYRTNESSLLLEGNTTAETHSVWINDYMLRLYEPGKTFWNYIADSELGTLQKGSNTYRIVTRNEEGQILDTLRYTIIYEE